MTGFLALGAMAYGVTQELHGRGASVGASIGAALRRFFPVLGFLLIYYAVGVLGGGFAGIILALGKFSPIVTISVAVVAIVIPVCMAMCTFFVVMPVCVVEKAGIFTSMSRSRFLTKGHRWQVFGTLLPIMVVYLSIVAVAGVFSGTGIIGIASRNAPVALTIAYHGVGIFIFAFLN